MKRFLFRIAFTLAIALFIWLIYADSHSQGPPKYRLTDIGSTLGPETRWPIQPGPPIHQFHCVGGPKNCGHIHQVPEPSSLALILLGLIALRKART